MSVRREARPADARLIEAYEGMRRRYGREDVGGVGHEVLRRQGLAAWIDAFSGCLCAAPRKPSPARPPSPLGRTAAPVFAGTGGDGPPRRLYPELTRLVACLALERLEGGP